MKRLSVLAVILLSSCMNAPPKNVLLPDGRTGFSVSCDGRSDSIANCMNAAAAQCGGAYDVVDRQEASTLAAMEDMAVTVPRRTLIFACKS